MAKVDNFARFFGLIRILGIEAEDRKGIVLQFTKGRTASLKEMNVGEYKNMCNSLNEQIKHIIDNGVMVLRASRSIALHHMQLMGIDTASWVAVDAFCKNPRIAGKSFRALNIDDLDRLTVKIRAIRHKNKANE